MPKESEMYHEKQEGAEKERKPDSAIIIEPQVSQRLENYRDTDDVNSAVRKLIVELIKEGSIAPKWGENPITFEGVTIVNDPDQETQEKAYTGLYSTVEYRKGKFKDSYSSVMTHALIPDNQKKLTVTFHYFPKAANDFLRVQLDSLPTSIFRPKEKSYSVKELASEG